MFVSPFTVSLGCDIAVIVIYLERPDKYGGTALFTIISGRGYTSEMVDIVSPKPRFMCCIGTGLCGCIVLHAFSFIAGVDKRKGKYSSQVARYGWPLYFLYSVDDTTAVSFLSMYRVCRHIGAKVLQSTALRPSWGGRSTVQRLNSDYCVRSEQRLILRSGFHGIVCCIGSATWSRIRNGVVYPQECTAPGYLTGRRLKLSRSGWKITFEGFPFI